MFDSERIYAKSPLFIGIIGYFAALILAAEVQETITINKIRSPKREPRNTSDVIRCFCNLPQCISTGYMCKSKGVGCFSNFLDHGYHHSKDYRGRHGCLELFHDKNILSACENSSSTNTKPTMACCFHDMCNHVDSPQVKSILNRTLFPRDPTEVHQTFGNRPQQIGYTNSQVWFRAATIAVPVCGAVILVVLIFLAVKILRNETQSSTSRKLRQYDLPCDTLRSHKCVHHLHHHPLDDTQRIRIPLLIPSELGDCPKKEINATMDFAPMTTCNEVILDIEKIIPKCSKSNFIEHVNTHDKVLSDKFKS